MTQLYENLKNKRNYKIHGVFWKGYCQYSVNTRAQILQESNWSGHGFAVTSVMRLRTVDVVTENEDCTVCAKGTEYHLPWGITMRSQQLRCLHVLPKHLNILNGIRKG